MFLFRGKLKREGFVDSGTYFHPENDHLSLNVPEIQGRLSLIAKITEVVVVFFFTIPKTISLLLIPVFFFGQLFLIPKNILPFNPYRLKPLAGPLRRWGHWAPEKKNPIP